MNKPSVYFETTVVGHIAARQQSDIIVAARQLSSCRWWACRDKYRIVISQVVIDECSAGGSTAATERLELLADMEVLALEGRNRTMRVMNPAASVAFDYGL